MNKAIETKTLELLNKNISTSDIIVLLTLTETIFNNNKSTTRTWLEDFMKANNIAKPIKLTKSGQLKDWFLSNPDPLSLTKLDIKEKCIELDMKGGSVTYYVNAYSLAVDLHKQLIK